MEILVAILVGATCTTVGSLVTRAAMKQERDEMLKQMDGMLSTIGAYQRKLSQLTGNGNMSMGNHTHNPHPAGIIIPTNHAYYEDDSEIGSRVWMDHISDPIVSEAAAALGLLEEGDELELLGPGGDVIFVKRFIQAMTEPLRDR